MSAAPTDLHSAWSRLFVRALADAGVRDVVVSPGSRSTPLVLALAREAALRAHVVLDERAAAFFALGQARVTGAPSALLCTSGTAAAHYLPAVIEAAMAHLPMLVLSADRPWEDYDSAAAQTIDQVKLFGGYARFYAELGPPDASAAALAAVPRIAAQAVARTLAPVPGPVHVNARFRKPLEPVAVGEPEPWEPALHALQARGAPRVFAARSVVAPEAVEALGHALARAERPVVVCGPRVGAAVERDAGAVLALARALGAPVFAEATSGLRFGAEGRGALICGGFDALLAQRSFRAAHAPDAVLQLGAPPVSPHYATWLGESGPAFRAVVAPHGWNDARGDASMLVYAQPEELAAALLHRPGHVARDPRWIESFARAESVARGASAALSADEALCEGAVARALVDALPERAVLCAGNSTPVRDLDTWCAPSARALTVLHQRGACGIDGLVAGAAGAASAADASVALLLGDLSLAHDVSSLALAARATRPLVLVVVQNGGGRIFEQLPLAASLGDAVTFERFFATPQALDLARAAELHGARHARCATRGALASALDAALATAGCTLIEAVVPPHDGAARRRALGREIARRLEAR